MADDRPMPSQSGAGAQAASTPKSGKRQAVKPAEPCAIVLFGATGDLANRLVIPALYNLSRAGMLPETFELIGVARAEGTAESWCDALYAALKNDVRNPASAFNIDHIDKTAWDRLANGISYVCGDATHPDLHSKLSEVIDGVAKRQGGGGNIIFYLAVADQLFGPVIEQLGHAKLTQQPETKGGKRRGWRRVIIEKPFGHSLDSARELNGNIRRSLQEDQIFRIDHFLGKDTVQSIMAFRFANGLFEPIWNRDRIDHVQITVAESLGVEGRGKFYEATGALRDMVPNHVLTLLSLVAMEPPVGFDAASVRTKRADVFEAMPQVDPSRAVRGQYLAGEVLGKTAKAYRHEPDVAPDSRVETFAAIQFEIDNWRWAGVPFYVRTGKHLPRRLTEIAICFKQAPYAAFQSTPVDALRPNWLVLSIAPDEGISLQFEVKRPGPVVDLAAVKMDFHYSEWFTKEPNVGYEVLIRDVMLGDQTLFMSADIVDQGWRIVQPVLDAWAADEADVPGYASGRDGPRAAEDLLKRDGRSWRPIAESAETS